jgi:hypothetical protein
MSEEKPSAAKVHAVHRDVVDTVKAMRAKFPKLSADGMAGQTAGAVAAMCMERIEALEKRLAQLESRPTMKYWASTEKIKPMAPAAWSRPRAASALQPRNV